MVLALLLASIAAQPPRNEPGYAADSHFVCRVGRKCFLLTRDGRDLLVPAGPAWIEPLQETIKVGDQIALGRMLQVGRAFRVPSGTLVQLLEQGPIVESAQFLTDPETSIVVAPDASVKRRRYWKVQFLADPVRDMIAVVAPENVGRLVRFKVTSEPRVRVANTPAHAAVAAFCRAANVDNQGKQARALTLYQAVLDKYPDSDAAILARDRIRAIEKHQ